MSSEGGTGPGPRDPLGKRALFSGPADPPPAREPVSGNGKRALFSSKPPPPLSVTVHCSSCDATTTLSLVDFLARHFPVWMWVPWRRHPHLMRCPACGRLAWHSTA